MHDDDDDHDSGEHTDGGINDHGDRDRRGTDPNHFIHADSESGEHEVQCRGAGTGAAGTVKRPLLCRDDVFDSREAEYGDHAGNGTWRSAASERVLVVAV